MELLPKALYHFDEIDLHTKRRHQVVDHFAGLLRRSRKRHLALAGIVLNLSCLLWGWHALSTAAAAILMVLGQTGLSFLSALAVLFGMLFFRQA